uniref:Uncharacterized protein n=1 Tax=Anguilla anguilla TaxID=7936 RepID=A0A0E9V5F3_ANGAN
MNICPSSPSDSSTGRFRLAGFNHSLFSSVNPFCGCFFTVSSVAWTEGCVLFAARFLALLDSLFGSVSSSTKNLASSVSAPFCFLAFLPGPRLTLLVGSNFLPMVRSYCVLAFYIDTAIP